MRHAVLLGALAISCATYGQVGARFPAEIVPPSLYEQAADLEKQGKGAEAVGLYIRAARGGNGRAASRLSEIYDKGIDGVTRDYAESLKWRNAARMLGESMIGPGHFPTRMERERERPLMPKQ